MCFTVFHRDPSSHAATGPSARPSVARGPIDYPAEFHIPARDYRHIAGWHVLPVAMRSRASGAGDIFRARVECSKRHQLSVLRADCTHSEGHAEEQAIRLGNRVTCVTESDPGEIATR